MGAIHDVTRFKHLTYDGFRTLARDASLSRYEKIGFPDAYRSGKEEAIFGDIRRKLTNLGQVGQCVLDIGPGCSDLPLMLIEACRHQRHTLLLVDSPEMLALLPDASGIVKTAGRFPQDCAALVEEHRERVNALLAYSVFHYVYAEASAFGFLDRCLELLAPGGQLLIGDIPSLSKRKRFFSSRAGTRFHQQFTGTAEVPEVVFNRVEYGEIDDAVIVSLVLRARAAGFDAYLLPQADDLPMANRREDVLICRP